MNSKSLIEQIERFVFDEADLLDNWKLDTWKALFTDECRYLIPPLNANNPDTIEPGDALFLAADDQRMLTGRVWRMQQKTAFVETPRSNIRHMVTNIRILSDDRDTLKVSSNFIIYRARRGEITNYVGRYFYILHRDGDGFKIHEKRCCLDNDVLQPQGSIGIIL